MRSFDTARVVQSSWIRDVLDDSNSPEATEIRVFYCIGGCVNHACK